MPGGGSEASERRARRLLLLGAAAGLAAAAAGLVVGVGDVDGAPGPDDVARVNGIAIPRDQHTRMVAALARDKRNPVSAADERHVLDRLIEEELLVQRGVEVGLVESDSRIRKAIVAAMIQSIVADAESAEPQDGELEAFFAENRAYFTSPPRLHVEHLTFRPQEGRASPAERARAARAALEHETPAAVRERLADAPVLELPAALLPPHKLREYLGPALVDTALALEGGGWSEPVETPQGWHLVRVVERSEPVPPELASVREQVAAEYRRRTGDRALREYLDWLRAEADVQLAPEAPR